MVYRGMTVKTGCEKEWRRVIWETLKGKDKESGIGFMGSSTLLTAGFLMTHLP